MNFFHEYALLIAIAIPVAVVVGINVALFLAGEDETLLLPGLRSFPSVQANVAREEMPATTATVPTVAPANDAREREAA